MLLFILITYSDQQYVFDLAMNSQKLENDRLINPSSKSVNYSEFSPKQLKKISDTDKFPCFSCYDKPVERLNCTVCNKMGYIFGSHPMVKFVDDFLTQNLASHLKYINQSKQSFVNDSHSSDQQFLEKKNTKKMQCRSALASYQIRDSNSSSTEAPQVGNLMKSTKQEGQPITHYGFKCDECDQNPIRGIRYKCKQCEDFDLCQACYREGKHSHQMDQIVGKHNMNQEVTQMIQNLKRSTRNRK